MKKMFPLFTPPLARLHNPTGAHDATDPPGSTLSLLASIVLATEPIGGAGVSPPIDKITRTNTYFTSGGASASDSSPPPTSGPFK